MNEWLYLAIGILIYVLFAVGVGKLLKRNRAEYERGYIDGVNHTRDGLPMGHIPRRDGTVRFETTDRAPGSVTKRLR